VVSFTPLSFYPQGSSSTSEVIEFFSNYLVFPTTLGRGLTQPLTEMSTKSRKIMFLWSKALPVHRADNFAAVF
jgi:hypothetical protein